MHAERCGAADALEHRRRWFRSDDVTAPRPRHQQFNGVYLTTELGNKPKRVYRKVTVDARAGRPIIWR